MFFKCLCVTLLVCLVVKEICAIADVHLEIHPQNVIKGQEAVLECSWKLGLNETLYSVMWHKDDKEIYRYSPQDVEPKKIFRTNGVDVNLKKSNLTHMTIENVNDFAAGNYSCLVTSEGAKFSTGCEQKLLEVIVLPETNQTLEADLIDGILQLKCTSAESHPVASLKLFINDDTINLDTTRHYPSQDQSPRYQSTEITAAVPNYHHYLVNDTLTVTCEAVIKDVYDVKVLKEISESPLSPQSIVSSAHLPTLSTLNIILVMLAAFAYLANAMQVLSYDYSSSMEYEDFSAGTYMEFDQLKSLTG